MKIGDSTGGQGDTLVDGSGGAASPRAARIKVIKGPSWRRVIRALRRYPESVTFHLDGGDAKPAKVEATIISVTYYLDPHLWNVLVEINDLKWNVIFDFKKRRGDAIFHGG